MDWPAKSPDMNSIEHAWDMLQRHLSAQPNQSLITRQELADALREECDQIPRNDVKTLIDSFSTRVRKVIQADEEHTQF